MEGFVFLLLTFALAVQAPHPDHHHDPGHPPDEHPPGPHAPDCHGPECDLINHAINDIGMYFDEHLCHAFIHVDCYNHVLPNDEQICASDGQTYDNHCFYAKARCDRVLDKRNYYNGALTNPLLLINHGPCVSPNAQVTTTTVQSSTSVPLTMSPATTGSRSTVWQPTTPFFTITAPASATSATTTTVQPINNVLGTVFCQYRNSINCGSALAVVCGSNGHFYPNKCELLKQQCDDPTLREVAGSASCSLSP
ncbi:uncharacterized protein LOC128547388 [Mercenaria mercenaria]|uniref:uncharacterized protein LOC128547388 n=1 Tax=Mercenaria mercenaria TaxID=6596 RepID=UPI00234ECA8D|nr:uncharacterized protein LOC128547388 [Mercenaria mercenaria]